MYVMSLHTRHLVCKHVLFERFDNKVNVQIEVCANFMSYVQAPSKTFARMKVVHDNFDNPTQVITSLNEIPHKSANASLTSPFMTCILFTHSR